MGREFKKRCEECNNEFLYVLESWDQEPPVFCSEGCSLRYDKKRKDQFVTKRTEECIPKKYRNLQTDKENLLLECMDTNLYIYGKCGTGKSIFIANLARKYLLDGKNIEWIETLDFFQKMRVAFSNNSSIEEKMQDYCYFKGVLFINDFGSTNKDFVQMQMLTLLDAREKNELLTVITSNLSIEDLGKSFDERIISRLVGMNYRMKDNKAIKTVYFFQGEDRRKNPEKWNNRILKGESDD